MDTLYSRERIDGDRLTPEELLEEAETERDRAKMEVIRLRHLIEATATSLDKVGFPDTARILREQARKP